MISTDGGIVWLYESRWPQPIQVLDPKTEILHKCSWDDEPAVMSEGGDRFTIQTVEPGVHEFACRCGQRVRISFEVYKLVEQYKRENRP